MFKIFFLSFFFSESYGAARSGGCFHGDSQVQTRSGKKKLSDLLLGDEVLALSSDGGLVFSEVISFLDRDPNTERLFYNIDTVSGQRLTLTPAHLVYYASDASTLPRPTFAARVVPGGFVLVQTSMVNNSVVRAAALSDGVIRDAAFHEDGNAVDTSPETQRDRLREEPPRQAPTTTSSRSGPTSSRPLPESDVSWGAGLVNRSRDDARRANRTLGASMWPSSELRLVRVRDVQTQFAAGVYAPLTREGTVVVNGVAASCYAAVEDQALAHLAFAPVRIWEDVKDSCLSLLRATGLLPKRTDGRPHESRRSTLVGVDWYADALYGAFYKLLPKSYLLE